MRLAILAAAALLLTACAADPEQYSTESSPTTETAPVAESSTPTPDAHTACALFLNGEDSLLSRLAPAIKALGSEATQTQVDEMLDIHDDLETAADHAPDDIAAALREVDEPFADFAQQVQDGGGTINIDTSTVATDTTEVMRLCNVADFKISDEVPDVE